MLDAMVSNAGVFQEQHVGQIVSLERRGGGPPPGLPRLGIPSGAEATASTDLETQQPALRVRLLGTKASLLYWQGLEFNSAEAVSAATTITTTNTTSAPAAGSESNAFVKFEEERDQQIERLTMQLEFEAGDDENMYDDSDGRGVLHHVDWYSGVSHNVGSQFVPPVEPVSHVVVERVLFGGTMGRLVILATNPKSAFLNPHAGKLLDEYTDKDADVKQYSDDEQDED